MGNKIQPDRKVNQVCYDIDHEVVRALKDNERDYCYIRRDFIATIDYIQNYFKKKKTFSTVYKVYNDKYGNFDYAEFIPVKCYQKIEDKEIELKGIICEFDKIPNNIKCVVRKPRNKYVTIKDYKEAI